MSFIKVRLKEVAADFGVTPKDIAEIISKYGEKPKSNTQVLTDQELNVVFDYMSQHHQISSLEQVFAVKPAKKAEEKPAAPKAAEPKPQQGAEAKPQQAAEQKTAKGEPERKRERRVVDTSAVQVNAARFDDRVDTLISERAQNFQGGKQRIGNKNRNQKQQGKLYGKMVV